MKPLAKILKIARDQPTNVALMLAFDVFLLGSAVVNYQRFGIEGLLLAATAVVVLSAGAIHLGFGSGREDWPKED
ncbi:MAG: hypothetical protein ACOYM5_02535 [Caulobacter sp.]